jgi:hypothetical protein
MSSPYPLIHPPLRIAMSARHAVLAIVLVLLSTTLFAQSANPVPLVNQPLVPSSVAPGSPQLALTVYGAGFVSTSVVNWNGAPLSTAFVSVDKLVAEVPSSDLASARTASVTVSSPAPGGGPSNAVPFTVTNPTTSLAFATSTHPVGIDPGGVVVADFNNDGKADLAVFGGSAPICSETDGAISILLGDGHGGFTTQSTICSYGNLPFSGVSGDFNNDGKLDLAVVSGNGSGACGDAGCAAVTIYLGNGDGTFTEHENFGIDGNFYTIVAADFNRDGNLDLAVSYIYFGLPNVAVFLGRGDGSFDAYTSVLSNGYLWSSAMAVGDFNNDGIIDIASVGAGGIDADGNPIGPVAIYLGNGDGTFTLAASQPTVNLVNPASVTAGDFNGDGILDLAIADAGSTALTILKGNGDGTFTQVSGEPTLPQFSNFVTTADLNGDGKLDLVFSSAANIVSMFLGNGDCTFQAELIEAMDYAPYGVAVGDFNGDGRLDLAVTNSSDNTVSILLQAPSRSGVTITLASGQNPVYVNQPVTYTVVVWASPTMPTGSVTFKQGATVLGTVPLANGQATFTTTFTKAGTFPIVASYSGDQNYRAKNSQAVKQVVKFSTTTGLASSLNPSTYGQAVIFTATVTSTGPNTPTGTVKFGELGYAPLKGGVAILTKTWLNTGTYSITAEYEGDNDSAPSTSPVLDQVVNPASTTTAITSSANPSKSGQTVTFTATVKSSTGAHATGTVTFTAGATTLGTVALSGIHASISTATLPVGSTIITATYNGATDFTGSSGSLAQTVD